MTPAEFVGRFPEFKGGIGLVPGVLTQAAGRVHAPTFGDQAEDAIAYLAAHLMANSPFGRNLRLDGDDSKATADRYLAEFERIRKEVVPSIIVL